MLHDLFISNIKSWGFPGSSVVKNPPVNARDIRDEESFQGVGEDLMEEEMATHSSILAKRIPRTEEPG